MYKQYVGLYQSGNCVRMLSTEDNDGRTFYDDVKVILLLPAYDLCFDEVFSHLYIILIHSSL